MTAQRDRPSAPEASNRRNEHRVDFKLKVSYPQRNAFFFEYTRNISRGGMFIGTESPFEPGTRVMFELEIPGEPQTLQIKGEVRWRVMPSEVAACVKNIPDLECGMGIAFMFDSSEARAAFESQVEQMLEDELGPTAARQLLAHTRSEKG